MSEKLVTIEAKVRDKVGKESSKKIKRTGNIPGNLLDKGKSTPLEINPKLLAKAHQTEKKFNLVLDGKTRVVKIQEVQIDPVKRTPIHIDLIPFG